MRKDMFKVIVERPRRGALRDRGRRIVRDELAARMPGCAIAKRQISARELAEASLANDVRD
jgi:hypothetical protein